jgi:hypothetical protein
VFGTEKFDTGVVIGGKDSKWLELQNKAPQWFQIPDYFGLNDYCILYKIAQVFKQGGRLWERASITTHERRQWVTFVVREFLKNLQQKLDVHEPWGGLGLCPLLQFLNKFSNRASLNVWK